MSWKLLSKFRGELMVSTLLHPVITKLCGALLAGKETV